jgi:hypothetical protein
VSQSFDNWINLTYLKPKPKCARKEAIAANMNLLRNQEEPSSKNMFRDMNYAQIRALAPSMVVNGKGDNPGGRFNTAWTSLWKDCVDKSHYERLAKLDKR